LLENGLGIFLVKQVQETNVEKSIWGTQNPCTFYLRSRRFRFQTCEVILLFWCPGLTTGYWLLTPPTNSFSKPNTLYGKFLRLFQFGMISESLPYITPKSF